MGALRPPEPTIEPKHFRPDEIEPGITKLRRLIDDKVHEEDPRVRALEKSIQSTILSVFTATSPEWRDHQYFSVDRVPKRVVSLSQNRCGVYGGFGGGHPGGQQPSQMRDEARRGYEAAIVELNSLVQMITTNEMRGRVMSVYNFAFRGGMPMGNLLSGWLVPMFTAPIVLGVNGVALVLVAVYFLVVQRRVAAL